MSLQLAKRYQRAIAWGLLLAVLIVAWVSIAQPILGYIDASAEERGIALRAVRRNRSLLREASGIQAAQSSVQQSPRWRNFYDGPKADAARLQLETDLRSIFKDSNNPTSISAEPATSHGTYTRIAVRVTLAVRVDQLADALDRIQKQTRQLRVENLIVQAPDFQGNQPNPTLSVQALISALWVPSNADRS